METYVYEIESSRGVFLDLLNNEITEIASHYKSDIETIKIQCVTSLNFILLITNNNLLIKELSKNPEYILEKI